MRLIGVNVLVSPGILYLLNPLSAVALDARDQLEDLVNGEDECAALLPHLDRDWAPLVFDEFRPLRTRYTPNVAWSRRPFEGETTTIGANGDRIHPPTTETPKQTVRFFGGSTV